MAFLFCLIYSKCPIELKMLPNFQYELYIRIYSPCFTLGPKYSLGIKRTITSFYGNLHAQKRKRKVFNPFVPRLFSSGPQVASSMHSSEKLGVNIAGGGGSTSSGSGGSDSGSVSLDYWREDDEDGDVEVTSDYDVSGKSNGSGKSSHIGEFNETAALSLHFST